MMKFLSVLPKAKHRSSVCWYASQTVAGVRFAIRRVSLQQRIELNRRLRDLTIQYEFLKAGGDAQNQLEAGLSDLLVAKLYLEWGVDEIQGLSIDGKKATVASVIAHGPEELSDEIVQTVQAEIGLTEDERKNC
jgi:hypothetical protein